MFTNISEILSNAMKLRLIFVANSVAAGKHRQAKFRRFLTVKAHDSRYSVTRRIVKIRGKPIKKRENCLPISFVKAVQTVSNKNIENK